MFRVLPDGTLALASGPAVASGSSAVAAPQGVAAVGGSSVISTAAAAAPAGAAAVAAGGPANGAAAVLPTGVSPADSTAVIPSSEAPCSVWGIDASGSVVLLMRPAAAAVVARGAASSLAAAMARVVPGREPDDDGLASGAVEPGFAELVSAGFVEALASVLVEEGCAVAAMALAESESGVPKTVEAAALSGGTSAFGDATARVARRCLSYLMVLDHVKVSKAAAAVRDAHASVSTPVGDSKRARRSSTSSGSLLSAITSLSSTVSSSSGPPPAVQGESEAAEADARRAEALRVAGLLSDAQVARMLSFGTSE